MAELVVLNEVDAVVARLDEIIESERTLTDRLREAAKALGMELTGEEPPIQLAVMLRAHFQFIVELGERDLEAHASIMAI